ncbi:MAG: lysylphosphatidylglycerol synthase transmembrane domain-containing protein [Chloroflexota bacterium]
MWWKQLIHNRPLRWTLTVISSGLFLYIAFRTLDWATFRNALAEFTGQWLIPVVGIFLFSIYLRSLLWQQIVRPLAHASVWTIYRASVLSIFANILLPLNIGVVLRAYLVDREVNVGVARLLGTEMMERVYSMVGFLLVSLVAISVVQLPGELATFRWQISLALGGSVVLGGVFIGLLLLLRRLQIGRKGANVNGWIERQVARVSTRYSESVARGLDNFVRGLDVARNSRDLLMIVIYSVLIRIVLAYHAIAIGRGFGVDIPLLTMLFVEVMVTFAAVIGDQLLGLIGSYQAAMSYALSFFGIPREIGLSLALIATASVLVPCLVLGFLFFWMEGLAWQDLKDLANTDKTDPM